MLFEFLRSVFVFALLAFGLAWPLAARLPLPPLEKILASAVLSLTAAWVIAWAIYISALSWTVVWLLPALAAGGLFYHRRALVEAWRDRLVRECLGAQLLVSAWCVGWLSLVESYSGGSWAGDWFEHWERAVFFLHHEPSDRLFLGLYSLTARPPLANVLHAVWMQLTRVDFAHYQLFSTLFASLAFLPAALLAIRWGGGRAAVVGLALLFMVNPLFVQNTVFPWTKLPTAFFTLAALYFFLRSRDGSLSPRLALLFSLALAAGLLTHYSTAPYAIVLSLGWIMWRPDSWRGPEFVRITVLAVGAGLVLLALWFGWACAVYGLGGTFASNTSVTTAAVSGQEQLWRVMLNLRDTFVPHFLRSPQPALLSQGSPWGYARDWFFQNYQLNLFLACGSIGWLVILRELRRLWPAAKRDARVYWSGFVTIVVLLGVAAHGARDEWGLAHICLQPLVLLGLAFLASRWPSLGRRWRWALAGGVCLDLVGGIVLHFAVQSYTLDRWLTPERSAGEILASYNPQMKANFLALVVGRFGTFNGAFAPAYWLVLVLLTSILFAALWRSRRVAQPPSSP